MFTELATATLMVLVTVMIHGLGLFTLARLLRLEEQEEAAEHIRALSVRGISVTLGVTLGLIALHGIEIWLYAFLFVGIGAIHDLREAVYFSTTTYAAIGYSDTAMAEPWRLVSAIEGINGILMIGWSTAFFVTVVARLRRL
jgi:ion channel